MRQQIYKPEYYDPPGIDLSGKRVIVGITQDIPFGDAGGVTTRQFSDLPRDRISRPLWPLDEPPFRTYGKDRGSNQGNTQT